MRVTEIWTGMFNVVLDDGDTLANLKDTPDMPHDYADHATGVYCYNSLESAQAAINTVNHSTTH